MSLENELVKTPAFPILNSHDVTNYFMGSHALCSLLDKEIKSFKVLGSGSYGSVLQLTFKDGSTSDFILKQIILEVDEYSRKKRFDFNKEIAASFNYLSTPSRKRVLFDLKQPAFPSTDFMWTDGIIAEYILMHELYKTYHLQSPHFLKVGVFNHCKKLITNDSQLKSIQGKASIFMAIEKADGILKDLDMTDPDFVIGLYVQGLHIIECMHRLGISHNDMHDKNILYTDVKDSECLKEYDYFLYRIQGRKIYIKRPSVLLKPADFGLALQNVGGKTVGNRDVALGRIDATPRRFIRNYDFVHFIYSLRDLDKSGVMDKIVDKFKGKFEVDKRYSGGRILPKYWRNDIIVDYVSFIPKKYLEVEEGVNVMELPAV